MIDKTGLILHHHHQHKHNHEDTDIIRHNHYVRT